MNAKVLLSGVIILGAVGLGVVVSTSAGQSFYTVDQFLDLAAPPNRAVKVRGLVVEDSLRETATTIDFLVSDPEATTGRTLPIHFDALAAKGQRPDTLMAGAEVVVEGHLVDSGAFHANTILAKCPSKYEEEGATPEYGSPTG